MTSQRREGERENQRQTFLKPIEWEFERLVSDLEGWADKGTVSQI
jgi:hypothetical protein